MLSTKDNYLHKQILTYLGNKRKLIFNIESVIDMIQDDFGEKINSIGEGFSGSGIVSRMLVSKCNKLYTNDIAGYSKTLNECYLQSYNKLTENDKDNIDKLIKQCNLWMDGINTVIPLVYDKNIPPFIQKYWAPKDDKNIKINERTYFTTENAIRIDRARYFIENYGEKYKIFLLAPLLVECSIHNNTNGQFSAYFKDEKAEKGKFGGKKEIDMNRITSKIILPNPLLINHNAKVIVNQKDTNDWVKSLDKVDLIYYDPPYNKHPYNIYYFLLDLINNWNIDIDIPDTYRGQPKNWVKSPWCSFSKAKKTFEQLVTDTKDKTKFLLLSYNNKGIIPLKDMDTILNKYGQVYKIPVEHKTYNKLKGIAAYKRKKKFDKVKEFLWLVDFR
jgi:adenine-specific DNA-methyltransferase